VLQEELGQLTLEETEVLDDHSSVQQQEAAKAKATAKEAKAKRARAEKSRVREANLNAN
jgi:hypothetical protein